MKMSMIEKAFVNSPRHSVRVSSHAEEMLRMIAFAPGQKYLDMGCGNGAAPIKLARAYDLDVTGIDVDPAQIQAAEKVSAGIANIHFATLDGTVLPFDDSKFNIVATNKVMHHIPHWEQAWAEMVRVLKPGGYLLFNDLVYPNWLAAIGRTLAKSWAGFPTLVAIETLIGSNNLRLIHRSMSPLHYEAVLQK